MKVWSRTLTVTDLNECVREVNTEFPGCALYLAESVSLHEGRRARRIDGVSLRSTYNRRHPNTGTRGAETMEWGGAASWTEWGWFLARVFDRDPDARCGDYRGRDDFHWQTDARFVDPRTPRERQIILALKGRRFPSLA